MAKKFHPISELEAKMKPEVLEKARKIYERESLNIKLSQLREKQGVKQGDVSLFTQTAVSQLENRKDIKISTLIDYLESLGMGLEIRAYPKGQPQSLNQEILLRV
jgi:transcriptional regulator with XRE-family HTH domain